MIVLAVAILPLLGVGGLQMFKAETPGPMKDSKLTPRITDTAKSLWLVYAASRWPASWRSIVGGNDAGSMRSARLFRHGAGRLFHA